VKKHSSQVRFAIFCTFVSLIIASAPSHASSVKGPWVGYTSKSNSTVTTDEGNSSLKSLDRDRSEFFALAPIRMDTWHLIIVPTLSYSEEHGQAVYSFQRETISWSVLTPGVILASDYKPLGTTVFALVNRYGDSDFSDTIRYMGEYIIGADFGEAYSDLKFAGMKDLTGRIIYRYRSYPGFQKYLTVVESNAFWENGMFLSVGFPSHVRLGWINNDETRHAYIEVAGTSRDTPVSGKYMNGWLIGNVLDIAATYKSRIAGPVFGSLKAGVRRDKLSLYDESGEYQWTVETDFAPIMTVAIETYFKS